MANKKQLYEEINKASELILHSDYVTAITGAGISVESGIRPFRGPDGLWTEKGEPSMDGYQKLLDDPKSYWKNRLKRMGENGFLSTIFNAEPNPGHYALAELEDMGILQTIITQNIDGLHEAAGSKKIIRIHGTVHKLRCINCSTRYEFNEFDYSEIPPRCKNCGGIVKSDTVMFGEPIPSDVLQQCFNEADKSDLMLVIGTSALVYPAAGLPVKTKRNGGVLVEVNPRETQITDLCDISLRGKAGESLPRLVSNIKKLR